MKKFLTVLSLIFAMFVFVSCVSDDDEEDEAVDTGTPSDTTPDSGNEGDTDTAADTGSENQTDPTNPTTPGDNTNPTDPTNPTNPTDPNCQPNCTGKLCGSDGCGGTCGMCGEGKVCNLNTFQCDCNPKCDGKTCGDDGCGGTCSCQNLNDVCDQETKTCKCVPNCDGKECGDNGCGEKCGTCGSGLFCNEGKCAESNCGVKICGEDELGNPCGGCEYKERCSIDQTQCISCSCEGRECGPDGCGGLCGLGGCGDDQGCNAEGKCVPCTCAGKVCGMNECGQNCGTCNYGEACSADQTSCLTKQCQKISIKDFVQTSASDPKNKFFDYTATYTPNNGDSKNHVSLTLYFPPYDYIDFSRLPFNTCTGEKPNNANNACAFIKEYTGDLITKLYYAQSGIMTITGGYNYSTGAFYAAVDRQPIFVEVDMNTGVPVPDGNCYQITNNPIKAQGK